MIICSSSNIDLIQGVSGYGTAADGATDWRIENTATGVFNILNSPNLLAPNVSIIDAGNVGVGTIPVSGTNKLQVQGNLNVSADTLSKTYTATNTTAGTNDILTMRYDTTNGLRFQQTLVAANDVRYDVIQKTNNVDYTSPVISFYKGNVGIGTNNPNAELQITCASTATNPDTGGTIIGLYVHNPTNTATSQNSVIYNRIANLSTGKVIYAFNVASSYGCSMVLNGNDATNRLLRFNNSSDASGTDLMVINNSNGNVSIGNTVTTTYKLNITGDVNVSGGYFVAGVAFKPATAVLADTATVLATSRNIAGVGFNGSGAIDIPYFNLTNKIAAGNGISLTTGSAVASPSISTNLTAGTGISISAAASPTISANLTAGTNVTFTGTAPNITINAAGGTASQWTTTGNNIYYNTGNVGIGTNNPQRVLHINQQLRIGGTGAVIDFGDDISTQIYRSGTSQELRFTTNSIDRVCIASNGNIGIGTNNPQSSYKLQVQGNAWVENQLVFNNSFRNDATLPANYACNKISLYGGANTPTTTSAHGFGVSSGFTDYYSGGGHLFYVVTTGGTTYGNEAMRIASNGNIGIGNNAPIAPLCIGNSAVTGSDGFIVIGKNSGSGSTRIFRIGYNDNYSMCFGDCGGNNTLGTWVQQVQIQVSTTASGSIIIEANGNVSNYLNSTTWQQRSDHRIKENIKKANVSICYDNVKNINLYRFNYIKGFKEGTLHDKTQLGFIAQQVEKHFPKSVNRNKSMLEDNREVPDLASIDVSQVNFTLFGAVKQLIRIVEKQSNRIKKLEEMFNIVEDDTVDDDADEPYVKIVCEGEVDIDTIVPSEPEETPENTSSSNISNSSNSSNSSNVF